MDKHEYVIGFKDATVADANRYCEDLRAQMLASDSSVQIDRKRVETGSMDFGSTLVMVLGAPATVAVAKAIIAWAKRNNRASISLTTKNGSLIADNLESKDVAAIAKALGGR